MDALRELGLSKYESLIYKSLIQNGISNAETISLKSSVPKTAVYPNLRSLASKGLIQELKGKVSLFEAISPSLAIKDFLAKRKKRISEIESKAIDFCESLPKEKIKKPQEVMWITTGMEASRLFYYELFEEAKKSVYIIGWRLEKIGDKYIMLRHLKKLVKRKIDVRIILTGSPNKQEQLIKDFKSEGIKMKYLPLDNFSIFIQDAKKCKITLKNRSFENEFNVQIADESLAQAMQSYFLDCWSKAQNI